MMNTTTYALCNTIVDGKELYPLEKQIRNLANKTDCFIIAVFDCCREKMHQEYFRGGGGIDDNK
jgi:hypothetical protein